MKVLLGSNEINDCQAALVINGTEVFRLRERESDGRLVCDFDVRGADGKRIAKVAKNNVVYAAESYKIEHLPRESFVSDPSGRVIARVQEIRLDTIRITGEFWIDSHRVVITDQGLISGTNVIDGNVISGFRKAISIDPESLSIGAR
jgi:hypothetical protein